MIPSSRQAPYQLPPPPLAAAAANRVLLPPPACRPPAPDQQLAVCRALARSLPASLPPSDVAALTALGLGWLAPAASGSTAAAALQLQAEAAHLLLALLGTAKAKLAPQSSRQLLQQLCRLCQQRAQPGSVASQELACGCMDLLAQLPQWYPQPPKPELAAAVAAVAAVLDQQLASGIAREETAAATRLLCKLLRALQLLLAEVSRQGRSDAVAALASAHLLLTLPTALACRQRTTTALTQPAWPPRCSACSCTAGSSVGPAPAAAPARPGGAAACLALPRFPQLLPRRPCLCRPASTGRRTRGPARRTSRLRAPATAWRA